MKFFIHLALFLILSPSPGYITIHYSDITMSSMASQITGMSTVCSNVCFRRTSKKTSKIRATGLCEGNPPVTEGFPSQGASNAENVSHLMTSSCKKRPSRDEGSLLWFAVCVRNRHVERDIIQLCRDIVSTNHSTDNRSQYNLVELCRNLFRILPRHIICAVIGRNYIAT